MEIVKLLKALGDETRIRILALLKYGELCVCDIEESLHIQQSNASRHLNKLQTTGLLLSRKDAQWVYYRINDEMLTRHPFIRVLLQDEVDKIDICRKDYDGLKTYKETHPHC